MKVRAWQTLAALAALAAAGALAQGALENPQDGATESGIAAITGWHCTSRNIELRIDGASIGAPGMGTPRADTASVCGRSDTGFSYLYNYALLKGGTHRLDAYADGTLFGSATFRAGYLGKEYLTGASSSHYIPDFPAKGLGTHVAWSQAKQNYVVTLVEPPLAPPLVGTYALRHVSMLTTDGRVVSTLAPGLSIGGTLAFRADGTFSMSFTLSQNGQALGSDALAGAYADHGFYVVMNDEVDVVIERGDTFAFHSVGIVGDVPVTMAISATRTGAGLATQDAEPRGDLPAVAGVSSALAKALATVEGGGR